MSQEYKEIIKKLNGQTVLIIDNERSNTNQLKSILEPATKIYVSEEQTHAINLINKVKPNIIFINLDSEKSEKFNGLEISQAIKQLEAFSQIPTIPIIIYSNNNGSLTQQRYQRSAADTLMIKPISEKNLVENISKHQFYKYILQKQ